MLHYYSVPYHIKESSQLISRTGLSSQIRRAKQNHLPIFYVEELLNPALQVEAEFASICSWQ
jgi:hypothetical protein